MPYTKEHAARLAPPDNFEKEISQPAGDGIRVLVGFRAGKGTPQSIRFDASKFTPTQAQAWLKAHNKKPISFEAADGSREGGMSDRRRVAARLVEQGKEEEAMMAMDGKMPGMDDMGKDADAGMGKEGMERMGKGGGKMGDDMDDAHEAEPPKEGEDAESPDPDTAVAMMFSMPGGGGKKKGMGGMKGKMGGKGNPFGGKQAPPFGKKGGMGGMGAMAY